jgi:hypothetical protein
VGIQLKSERIATWLTLLANLSVLVGLILLALEMHQNTSITRAVLHQEIMSYARDHFELLVTDENEKLASIVFRGESDPESLSAVELDKFLLFTAYRMGGWEATFVHHDEDLLLDRHWELWDRWYSSLLDRGPGYKRWWEATRHGYDSRFQDHVDRAFSKAP